MSGVVVAVGMRRPAVEAAARLGLRVVAVVEAEPGPVMRQRLHDAVIVSFDTPAERWSSVAVRLGSHRPTAVVALTERSVLPAAHLRAALGLPGQTVTSAVLCSDKRAMKRAVRAAGLACADFVEAGEGLSGAQVIDRLGLPLVLKNAIGSGSRGTCVVHDARDVPDWLPPGGMAESFVEGVEMSAETFALGGETLLFSPTQYLVPAWSSLVPAPLPPDDRAELRAMAEAARRALGVEEGMTHLEVFRTSDGLVFGEMAARPPGGHLMPLIALAYGVDPWEALWRVAQGERPDFPQAERCAAVRLLHPGAGTVAAVEGVERARSMPGVEAVSVRVRPGEALSPREGTGQEAGHILVTATTPAEAEARLRDAVAAIRIALA